jgi:hypothetical protein
LQAYEKERPRIVGGIFDVVSKAMTIYPTVKLDNFPRMADFVGWGCAIAEALGYTRQQFLDAYYRKVQDQNTQVLYESLVAGAVIQLMETESAWEGTPSALLHKLVEIAVEQGVDVGKEKDFPKAANVLSRKLNRLKTNLADEGIEVRHGGVDKKRIIYLRRTTENTVSSVEPSNAYPDDVDDDFANL